MMKNLSTTILLLLTVLYSYSQNNNLNKKISVSFNNITLTDAFVQIEKKSDISFAYNSSLKELKQKITKKYSEKPVNYILDDILKNTSLEYKLIGNKITIYKKKQKSSSITISGYIYDTKNGEVLIGCSIYDPVNKMGATTNVYGFYSLTVPKNKNNTIVFSFIGYESQKIDLSVLKNKQDIRLVPVLNELAEVVVSTTRINDKVISNKMSVIKLNTKEINSIPAIGGEVDVLKAITLLPGVKQGVDGSSGFYVRGGGPDQNLILLDGVPLYNPYHLWGFLSTFNSDAINNIEITKGAFPARYGGRLSAVLDITTKDGNNQKWQKDITIGLLSAKASVSGPLVKDKSSIMVSARRTYADLIVVPILKMQNSHKDVKTKQGYNFTDFNLKYNYKLTKNDRLFVSGFYSKDKYYYETKVENIYEEATTSENTQKNQGWGNIVGSVRWNHIFGDKLFLNTTAYYSSYDYYTNNFYNSTSTNTDFMPNKKNSIEFVSKIDDIAIKQDYHYYPNNKHKIKFGIGGIYHAFNPGVTAYFSETDKQTIDNSTGNKKTNATELSVYVEDDFKLNSFIGINAGLHTSGFIIQNTKYISLQPRLSTRFLINENLSFKLGYAKMTQYIHLLTSSGLTQASDLWISSTDSIKPQQSHQISLGSAFIVAKQYQVEIDAYYKTMSELIDYRDGASFLSSGNWDDKIASGSGYSYGMELFIKKTKGKLTGWLGYTLSWTNRQFKDINFGKEYPYKYDRRHDISLVGMYKLNKKWSLNGSWVFYTGNAVSVPTSTHSVPGYDGQHHSWSSFPTPYSTEGADIASAGIIESYTARNNYRLPVYHRLDISATRIFQKEKSKHELNFGLTNLYNKMNPSFYKISHERNLSTGEAERKYYTTTLFPLMPTISYKVSF